METPAENVKQNSTSLEIIQQLLISGVLPAELPVELQQNETFQIILDEINQLQQFALQLSNGDLQQDLPMKGHTAGALKTLQANLRHLTWQAQTIADGDFNQQVDFMGDFSSAFNAMVIRLREQRATLEQRANELTIGRREALELMHQAENARHETEAAYANLQAKMAEINTLQAQLREQAIRDPLTGCFNRRYMDETLQREFARAVREQYPLCLVMADIDRFKRVNDTYGHAAGDIVLQTIGYKIRNNTRTGDMVCRYGGEEFLVVLPNIHLEAAALRVDHWRERIQEDSIRCDAQELHITISMGLACFPTHGNTIEEVLHAADDALYHAKHSGRNRVCTADNRK